MCVKTKAMGRKHIALIDGHSLAYRMYFALERTQMHSKAGVPTWAVFGFFKALIEFVKQTKPDGLALAFDMGRVTFRTELFENYKAHRESMPDDMRTQMQDVRRGIETLGLPIYELENYEADDLLGTLAKQAVDKGYNVTILTGDQDAFQLIDANGHVKLLMPGFTGGLSVYNWNKVIEKWGVSPEQVIDFKGLKGDTSDNIPGVPGVGDKTAAKLLQEYQTLEGIYNNLTNIKGKLKEKLETYKDQAFLSKQLATIDTHSPVTLTPETEQFSVTQFTQFIDFLQEMECRSLLEPAKNIFLGYTPLLAGSKNNGSSSSNGNTAVGLNSPTDLQQTNLQIEVEDEKPFVCPHQIINTLDALNTFITNAVKTKVICLDIETTGLDYFSDVIVGISLSYSNSVTSQSVETINPLHLKQGYPNAFSQLQVNTANSTGQLDDIETIYVPIGHANYSGNLSHNDVMQVLKPVFENPEIIKIAHNAKFEWHFFQTLGIVFKGLLFDTMVASYVLNPERQHGLKALGYDVLGIKMQELKGLLGSGKNQITFNQLPIEMASPYAALDTYVTLQLASVFTKQLQQNPNLNHLLYELEFPFIPVLAQVETHGVSLDSDYLKHLSEKLELELGVIEGEIFDLAGLEFNINSPKQVGEILFDKLGLPNKEKTASKTALSTNAKILEGLVDAHPIVQRILDYRQLFKLKSTYVDALPELVHKVDNRLHTSFNQTIAATGRLSSSNPNLQNIPIRSELGRSIRKAFIPRDASQSVILSADYSQIELRLLAHFSEDENLCQAFLGGLDIHQATAALVFDIPLEKVTKQQRYQAKAVNFGVIYGQTAYGLSRSLGIAPSEAAAFIEAYFEQYPKVKFFIESTKAKAYDTGVATTIFGRERDMRSGLASGQKYVREFTERAAFNTPLQGSAADLMKMAMIRLEDKLSEKQFKTQLILQVHDEVVLEVAKPELDEVQQIVSWALELEQPLKVPLVIDQAIGPSWMEAE